MKTTSGEEVILSSTNQKQVHARNKRLIIHRRRTKNKPEPVSSIEDSDVVKSLSKFPIVDLKDYDIAKKTKRYFPIKHVIEKSKM